MSMTREQAWDLLTQYNQEEFHLRHAVTVEHVMRWFARELGYGDREEFWGIVGLLHDLDFERWPEEHCKKSQELMRQAGVEDQHIFVDKATGKHFNRPAYRRMLCRLRPGDLLVVQSIDRLGRNYEEMLRQWRLLVEEKQVDVQVLDMPLLDTRRRKSATTALMADMLLRLLSYIAQAEREAIRSRQAQGIAAAKPRPGGCALAGRAYRCRKGSKG